MLILLALLRIEPLDWQITNVSASENVDHCLIQAANLHKAAPDSELKSSYRPIVAYSPYHLGRVQRMIKCLYQLCLL